MTTLAYWLDTYKFRDVGHVVEVKETDTKVSPTTTTTTTTTTSDTKLDTKSSSSLSPSPSASHIVVLDSTIFHPQGGGQPSDTGVIRTESV
jgi:Ser-tRNA(Ala) deacylase AlaX